MGDRSHLNHASVIDQHIETSRKSGGPFDKLVCRRAIGQVADQNRRANAARFQIVARTPELGLITSGEDDKRAKPTAFTSDREAESSRPTGDKDGSSMEIDTRCESPGR
jgi:hypothetical protein